MARTDMDYTHRPHLMTVYLPEVDQAGHKAGPDSRTVEKALGAVDEFVKEVFDEVDKRNLSRVVDVIVVSDHGMAGAFSCRFACASRALEKREMELQD